MRNLILLSVLASACAMGTASPSASAPLKPVSFESGPQCLALCTDLGLKMSALVIVDGKTACVCRPPGDPNPQAGAAASAAQAIIQKSDDEKKASTDSPNLLQEQKLQEDQKKQPH
ncbi:MAG TPA: hypothetical protein VH083_02140 [Myxococcales bacterium]|jgi:hypothetical protein|nr:hypothetical protein [Myxococcales bacterium]